MALVCIAGRLAEGKRVEEVLSANATDYAVASEPFQSRVLGILPVEYEDVGFYVLSGQADVCRRVFREAGLVRGLVAEDDLD